MQKYLDNKQSPYRVITNNQVVSQNAIKLPSLPHSDTVFIHNFLYSIYLQACTQIGSRTMCPKKAYSA